MKEVLAVLDKVECIVADVPPVENGKSRFGNPAFRTFYDAVQSVCPVPTSLPRLELIDLHALRKRWSSTRLSLDLTQVTGRS